MEDEKNKSDKDMEQGRPTLKEGLDYYFIDGGLMVFTAHYLKKRGYCCQSSCRHCPY